MSLTWRKSWISCFESPISVFDKISYANEITQKEFHQYFKGHSNKESSFPLINHLDYQKIQDSLADHEILMHFKTSILRLSHIFHGGIETPGVIFCRKLYLCNICALDGYHSFLFQSKFIQECPFHCIPLTNLCRNCEAPLMYNYFKSDRISQCCNNCSEPILRHIDTFPNYPVYTEQHIKSNVALEYLHLNDKEIKNLQNTHIQGIRNDVKTKNPEFIFYCAKESIRYK